MKAYICTKKQPYPEKRAKKETPEGHIFLVTHPDASHEQAVSLDANGKKVGWIKHVCPYCKEEWGRGV